MNKKYEMPRELYFHRNLVKQVLREDKLPKLNRKQREQIKLARKMLRVVTSAAELRADPQSALVDALAALLHWVGSDPVNTGNHTIDFGDAERTARNHVDTESGESPVKQSTPATPDSPQPPATDGAKLQTFDVKCAFDVPAYFTASIEAETQKQAEEIAHKQCQAYAMEPENWDYAPDAGGNFRVLDYDGESEPADPTDKSRPTYDADMDPNRHGDGLEIRTHTIAQFVADYFAADRQRDIDYSELKGKPGWPENPPCWNGYVGWIATAGSLLEDVVQESKARGEQIAEWYEILEESTLVLHTMILDRAGEPDYAALRPEFEKIVNTHLEK